MKFVSPLVGPPAGPNRPIPTARPPPPPLPSHRLPTPAPSQLPLTLKAIQSSWLARVYRSLHLSHPSSSSDSFAFDAIARDLYDSDQDALRVAMRFVLARFGRELMLCGMMDETGEASGLEGGREGGWGVLVGLERMGGEVWRIDVARSGERKAKQKQKEKETSESAEEQESWWVLGTVSGLITDATRLSSVESSDPSTSSHRTDGRTSRSRAPDIHARLPLQHRPLHLFVVILVAATHRRPCPPLGLVNLHRFHPLLGVSFGPSTASFLPDPNAQLGRVPLRDLQNVVGVSYRRRPGSIRRGHDRREIRARELYRAGVSLAVPSLFSLVMYVRDLQLTELFGRVEFRRTSGEYQTAQKQCDLFAGIVSTASTFATLNSHLALTAKTSFSSPSIQLFLPLYAPAFTL